MYFKSFNKTLMNRLQSLLPEVQQITCSKVCNFLTLNLSDESGLLSHSGKIINNEHIYALAYLQSNFKNHIVNKSSISNIKKILQTIQNSEYEEIKQHFWGTQSRKSQAHRKNFYIFDKIDISQQLMKCSLMMNKNYNKILCFPNQNPFSISSSFEKFCLQYNVRALGLNEFSIRYLIKHISKVSKSSILLHEILSDDLSIFKEQKGIDSPRQLIIFMEKIKEKDRKGKKFLQLKQILKNFIKRQTFQAKLNIESKNFTITRLQHILDFQKYSQYMQLKQNIDKFKKRPSEVKTRNESHNHFTLFITQFLWLTKFIFDFNIQFSHTMDNKHQLLRKCKIAFECQNLSKYEVFILKDEIWTFPSASQSVILSSAAYILKIFPRLPHPKYFDAKPPNNRIDSEYPSCFLSLNPLFDEWVELITEALFEGNVFRVDQTLYLKLIVCKQFGNELKKNIDHQTYAKSQSIFSIFGLNQRKKEKRVAWINCSTSQINKQTFHPNINAASILLGQIYNNEEYDMYNILKGNIPTVQQLLTYDALIIPGSGLSVLSKVQQIQQLSKVLLSAYQKSEKLKILGICYGHQLLAKIFGATVVKRARCHGLQLIKFNKQTLKKFSFLQPLFKYESGQLFLSQHHEDFVTTVPKQFLQLAVSKSCENQALVSKNGRIFSSQFHPEYMYPFTKAYVARLNTFYNDEISQKPTFSHSKQKIQQHIRNCEDLRQCISMFL